MAEDFVETLLEEPFRRQVNRDDGHNKNHEHDRGHYRERERDREKDRNQDRERDNKDHNERRRRNREQEQRRSRSRDRDYIRVKKHDQSREQERSKDCNKKMRINVRDNRERERVEPKGNREKDRNRRSSSRDRRKSLSRERGVSRKRFSGLRGSSPHKEPEVQLSPEERDVRTVFCMQLSARIKPRDLEEFFSAVGKVRDVRLILDNKSHRSKGIAYIEFVEVDSVQLALGLTGTKLLGVPIIVQPSHAERNRLASAAAAAMKSSNSGPMRLYVGSLHYNIDEDMLNTIFSPFGKIDDLKLMKDHQTGRSAGYCFITFHNAEDAKKAMDQMNGYELAGRPMKIGTVTEKSNEETAATVFDIDEMDRYGFGMSATSRLQLMAKLAEGTGMKIPAAAANVLNSSATALPAPASPAIPLPPIATQCFMLSNMFDPNGEKGARWEDELKDDVIDECNKHGGVLHIYIDCTSPQGNIYVKCPSLSAAAASVGALHGRYFDGKLITAAYVPLPNYHQLFPDSQKALQYLMPSTYRPK